MDARTLWKHNASSHYVGRNIKKQEAGRTCRKNLTDKDSLTDRPCVGSSGRWTSVYVVAGLPYGKLGARIVLMTSKPSLFSM